MTGVQTCALPICFPVTIVGVGIDTYQQKKQDYIEKEKAKQEKTKKTDAQVEVEANKEAAKAAAFAYNMNQMNILLNLTSSLKFLKPSISGSRLGLATDNIFNSALNTAERTGKQQAYRDWETRIISFRKRIIIRRRTRRIRRTCKLYCSTKRSRRWL